MGEQRSVVAAIPNYNMGHHLRKLLPQVLRQGYDRVFVLDDGSTDDSVDVIGEFGDDVTMVRTPKNRGCTFNRNQIIDHVGDDELIHFIDADMDLGTSDIAAVARDLAARYAGRGVGAIGGLVSRTDGSQEPYNYGPVFSLKTNLTAMPPLIDRVRERPRTARALEYLSTPVMKDWPNVLKRPAPASAYWLHEGNLLIHSGVYRVDRRLRREAAQSRGAGPGDPIGAEGRSTSVRSEHSGHPPLHRRSRAQAQEAAVRLAALPSAQARIREVLDRPLTADWAARQAGMGSHWRIARSNS